MEILGFTRDFKKSLDSWRADFTAKTNRPVDEIAQQSPALRSQVEHLDEQLGILESAINTIGQDKQTVASNIIAQLHVKQVRLLDERSRHSIAVEEYKRIVEPIKERIKTIQHTRSAAMSELQTLKYKLQADINSYILASNVAAPTFETQYVDHIFDTGFSVERKTQYTSTIALSCIEHPFEPFCINPQTTNLAFDFLVNIPAELEATKLADPIRAAYATAQKLKTQMHSSGQQLGDEENQLEKSLIPWANRFGYSRAEGDSLVSSYERQGRELAQVEQDLAAMQKGGKDAEEMTTAEIQKRLEALPANKSELVLNIDRLQKEAKERLAVRLVQTFNDCLKSNAAVTLRTGSKGDFTIPSNIAYVYATRVRGNGERILWFLPIKKDATNVHLSASNAHSTGGPGKFDEFWVLSLDPK